MIIILNNDCNNHKNDNNEHAKVDDKGVAATKADGGDVDVGVGVGCQNAGLHIRDHCSAHRRRQTLTHELCRTSTDVLFFLKSFFNLPCSFSSLFGFPLCFPLHFLLKFLAFP